MISSPLIFDKQFLYKAAAARINALHEAGQRVVFTNGCFDMFHAGHLKTLQYCRELAGDDGYVVVGVNSDVSVKANKGYPRPIIPETQRAQIVAACRYVDYVVVFEETTPYELIVHLEPDFIVKGPDHQGTTVVGSDLAKVKICPYSVDGVSTTEIISKIKKG